MEQLSWAIANLGDGDGALLNQAYITSLDMSPMLQADAKVTAITFQDGSESRGSDCVVRELDSSVPVYEVYVLNRHWPRLPTTLQVL
jgi:hypothetical protein